MQRALDDLSTYYFDSKPTKLFIYDICTFWTQVKKDVESLKEQTIGGYLRGLLIRHSHTEAEEDWNATPLRVRDTDSNRLYGFMGSYFGDIVYMHDYELYIFKV